MIEPGRIVVAGDWHANTRWAEHVIAKAGELLKDEALKIILHLGDFGIWRDAEGYIDRVSRALEDAGVVIWFIDGNHEDFPFLKILRGDRWGIASIDRLWRIFHIPRGQRWYWYDKTWLAIGGAVSVDRACRTEGTSWFPEEAITEEQATRAIADGHADVLVSHDCPSGVPITFPPPPRAWSQWDLDNSELHRQRLQRIVDAVKPSHVMHGHLHMGYARTCDFGYGPVEVTGLNMDGERLNYAMLDTRTMTWELP
jgi:hypothetical protein